ncbi:MAG: hypothetical protein HOM58_02110 [Rhodospirillaceae bacterium]|jgi:hypothetical protein|nr:hypothetical protein [Rhodospirillaceae bacterium]
MSAGKKKQPDLKISSSDAHKDAPELLVKPAPGKSKKWMVRGVPVEIRQMVSEAAKGSGKTIGELVAEALAAYLPTLEGNDVDDRDPLVELDALAQYVEERLFEIEGRMKSVEAEDRLYRLVQRPWIRSVS